ncbi:MAG: glycosyltransferase [Verrucomicrobiales bacterium]|nr:glycosyltransferase [Verrucomicrobiales bacterium]
MSGKINIIARRNGVGLDRDVDLLHDVLSAAGFEVTISHCRGISPFRHLFPRKAEFDANLFVERIFPRWFGSAPVNIVIPNQERFPKRHLPLLRRMDHVLAKTAHGDEIFSRHVPETHLVRFSSPDLFDPAVSKNESHSCLHLAGRSTLKGTETVLALWKKHPEWPQLTLIQCRENAPESVPDNVTLLTDYLSDEEIRRHLNANPIHLCPSLSEGWGHYIVEAMSCGAVVVTTDGPPMNELITEKRGVTVPFHKSEPRHLGTNFFVDPDALESKLEALFKSPPESLKKTGDAAKEWFASNDQQFRETLARTVKGILHP